MSGTTSRRCWRGSGRPSPRWGPRSSSSSTATTAARFAGGHRPHLPGAGPAVRRRPGARGATAAAPSSGAPGTRVAPGCWCSTPDMQHPPEAAGVLAGTAIRHDADIVVATRYAGTRSPRDWPGRPGRLLVAAATRLAKCAFPRRLAMVSDPLSGMFAFRRRRGGPRAAQPRAFRVLLEILVRHPAARVAEVAYPVPPHRRRLPRSLCAARRASCATSASCGCPGWPASCGSGRRPGPGASARHCASSPSGWWG